MKDKNYLRKNDYGLIPSILQFIFTILNNKLFTFQSYILDFSTNLINGGSIIITVAKNNSKLKSNTRKVKNFLNKENKYINSKSLELFKKRVKSHKQKVLSVLKSIKKQKKVIYGYGASTKGNVIINYCNITKALIPKICDENKMKDGQITPGSKISQAPSKLFNMPP